MQSVHATPECRIPPTVFSATLFRGSLPGIHMKTISAPVVPQWRRSQKQRENGCRASSRLWCAERHPASDGNKQFEIPSQDQCPAASKCGCQAGTSWTNHRRGISYSFAKTHLVDMVKIWLADLAATLDVPMLHVFLSALGWLDV